MRVPIVLTCHWRCQLYISLQLSKILIYYPDWNRAIECNNKPTRRKQGEKIAIQKNIRKAAWNSKILKNKSKERDSDFLVEFSSSKAERANILI